MKKYILISLLVLGIVKQSSAQNAGFFSGGFSLLMADNNKNDHPILLPAITIFPGFKLIQKKEFSLLAGTPASIGLVIKDDHFSIGVDLPISVSMISGFGFSNQSKKRIGFFLGGGAGYHNSFNEIDLSDGSTEKNHVRFIGFLMHAGIIVPESKTDNKNGVLIRLSWMSEYPDHEKNVFGIGLIAW